MTENSSQTIKYIRCWAKLSKINLVKNSILRQPSEKKSVPFGRDREKNASAVNTPPSSFVVRSSNFVFTLFPFAAKYWNADFSFSKFEINKKKKID